MGVGFAHRRSATSSPSEDVVTPDAGRGGSVTDVAD
jgi:hypothetical protein